MQKRIFKKSILLSAITVAIMSGFNINKAYAEVCLTPDYATARSPVVNNGFGYIQPTRPATNPMGCTDVKTVDTLQGSASVLIEKIKSDIIETGEKVVRHLEANSSAEISMQSEAADAIIQTIVKTTDQKIEDEMKLKRSMLSMEMDYMAELKERELRANDAPMELDDTAEEVKFMLNELEKSDSVHVQEILTEQYAKYGVDGKIIPLRIKSGENSENCPEYDPNVHFKAAGCFFGHKAFPAQKLAKYFEECSRTKRRIVSGAKKNAASAAVASTVQKSQNEFANSTTQLKDSLINTKIEQQASINCSPYDFKKDYCLKDMKGNESSYVEKVIANEIIPNGNISSNNLFKPTAIGSIDGAYVDTLTDKEKSAITSANIDLESKEGTAKVAVSDNTVPIVYTYRTSSQYLAAKDFVNNILSKEMMPNQSIDDRKKASNGVYQSRFLSRAAALSVAEVSLNKSIEARLGKKIREAVEEGKNLNPYLKIEGVAGTIVKEDINGAGYMDELSDSINKDYQKVIVNGQNKIAGSAAAESLSSMSSKKPAEWQLEAIIKQNEVTLEQYHQGERIEALLSALLAQKANSPENIKYLEDLRRQ